ncbi:uncharacterized protein LOC107361998 isoform X2 [Tetranychus urticae]|uniref:F-box domain-containing protein n=1 Tax=Tetranychus urticae TaxID=32264 RepID=T1KAB7_TETUR|nr:uncharacterized protein LOC107361998 isoform X3 [Tetranychus urticae]XP_025016461.1 uncharacterized protein LOC107361998 isoform X2 [Tetranychus urticae]
MLINEIPDDCLLAIFDYIIDLDDLINCYKVCVKWRHLIAKRTKKVKYLIGQRGYSSDAVYFQRPCVRDVTYLSKLFTNLQIAELSPGLHLKVEDAIEFVSKQESLRGLISRYRKPIEKYCDQLEMLSVNHFNPNNLRNGSSIKQLDIWNYSLEDLKRDAHYMPNLERLKVEIDVPDNPYDGPVLEKLKILEMAFRRPCHNIFYGFQFMDSCPNLQSAHILMSANTSFFDETLKHKCLQDLVFQFYGLDNADDTWNYFKRLFKKFPNLKHLALRGHCIITDEHIEQLVHILPNLVLLDAVECQEVTQRAADYVQDYCKRYGRSIKFYYNGNEHEIKSDWPQLSNEYEVISRGFDFMKHCFRKDWIYVDLSCLLVPIDY